MELKQRLSQIRQSHVTQKRAQNAIVTKPFLTEAELAAEIGNIPGNSVETRADFETGTTKEMLKKNDTLAMFSKKQSEIFVKK